jgi:DNA-binding CsgD family transcriptional regulator
MPGRLVSPTLVGRAAELESLAHAIDLAIAGTPLHQLVGGEAGVGKSRLVREVSAIAVARGMRVLAGGCADIGDGGVPYGPIVEALRALVRELDDAELATVVGSARGDLARLVPSLGPAPDSTAHTETLQPRLLDAVLGVLHRLSEVSPVLLVVEDLHWADPATRETVAFLVRQLRRDRVLILMTFRSDEMQRRHPLLPWLAEMGRSGRAGRLDLARLDNAQTGELLEAILEKTPAPDLVDQIHRRSDGNPFFVEELLGAGEDAAIGPLPATLREVLLARIVALPELTQAVIRVAAVAGRRVDHDLLAEVADLSDPELTEALRTAVGRQVLVTAPAAAESGDAGDYAFRHALLQEVAYDDLLPGERQRLHRAFAVALAERGEGSGAMAAGHWAELAYHWTAARQDERAFEASIRAGDAAARAFAFADSRRHDERALELWSTIDDAEVLAGIDRVGLLDRAAVAAWLSGDSRRATALRREAVDALRPANDPIRLGTAMERLGRALWYNGEVEAAIEAYNAALDLLPIDPPTPELARALAGYAQMLMLIDRIPESRGVAQRAVAMARQVGARQAEGHALNTYGISIAASGNAEESEAALDEALEIAREVGSADDIGRAYVNLTAAKITGGEPRAALQAARTGAVAADAVGLARTYGTFIRENGIAAAFEIGEWAEAERLAEESIDLSQSGQQHLRYGLSRWVAPLVARGDERAESILDQLRGLVDGFRVEGQFHGPYRIAAAEASLWRGDPATALTLSEDGLREYEPSDPRWYKARTCRIGMRAAADLAEVARARRDSTAEQSAIAAGDGLWKSLQPLLARLKAEQHGMAARATDAEVAVIEAERWRLRGETAAEAWAHAGSLWNAHENPYLDAYCRWREAEARLGDGNRAKATATLVEAHRIAARLGARPLQGAIEALATRARIDLTDPNEAPPPAVESIRPADPFGLTRRERDVLPLLVQGRTNRQIAEALFISENTAGVHVSNILGKLGASSRTEAAGIAVRLGLGDA